MNDSAEVGGKTCFQARTMRRTQETVVCELPKGGALSKGGWKRWMHSGRDMSRRWGVGV